MDTATKIDKDNALTWYASLNATERDKLAAHLGERGADVKVTPEIALIYGARPRKPADPVDPLEGYSHAQLIAYEAWRNWCKRYDEAQLVTAICEHGPAMQAAARLMASMSGAPPELDGTMPDMVDPGLDPMQQTLVRWLQVTGAMPVEILAGLMRDEEAKPSDRINAARTLMDYVHRRVPVKQEIDQKVKSMPRIDPAALAKLSDKELAALSAMMDKMAGDD